MANNSFIVLWLYDITLLVIVIISLIIHYLRYSVYIVIYRLLPYCRTSVNNWKKSFLFAPFTLLLNYLNVQLSPWSSNSCPKPPTLYLDPFPHHKLSQTSALIRYPLTSAKITDIRSERARAQHKSGSHVCLKPHPLTLHICYSQSLNMFWHSLLNSFIFVTCASQYSCRVPFQMGAQITKKTCFRWGSGVGISDWKSTFIFELVNISVLIGPIFFSPQSWFLLL